MRALEKPQKCRSPSEKREKMQIRTVTFQLLLMMSLIVPNALAQNWYIDAASTSSGDGKSFVTAWKSFADINWALVQPGHTIWISGGNYPEYVQIGKAGTQALPIVLKASQEVGHNGLVTIYGLSMNGANWVTIDGAKSDSYAPLLNGSLENTWAVSLTPRLLTDNINIKIDPTPIDSHGLNLGSGSLTGFKIKWVEVTTSDNDRHGFRFNPSTGIDLIDVGYSWIHDIGTDAVTILQNAATRSFANFVTHHSIIERVGDDGFEISSGMTVHHSVVRDARFLRGHPDGIQSTGSYVRLHNNVFSGLWGNSNFRIQGFEENYTAIQLYNNLFFSRHDTQSLPNPGELVWYGNQQPWNTRDNSNWKDWVIVGNTFANFETSNAFSFSKRAWLQNAYIKNLRVQNNIFLDISRAGRGGGALSIPGGDPMLQGTNCCWYNSEDESIFETNVVTRSIPAATLLIGYNGVAWPNAEALNSGTKYNNNSSVLPLFMNVPNYDYRPQRDDPVARNRASNLSALGLPDIGTDLTGAARGTDGAWDIGAFEYTGTEPPGFAPNKPTNLSVTSSR